MASNLPIPPFVERASPADVEAQRVPLNQESWVRRFPRFRRTFSELRQSDSSNSNGVVGLSRSTVRSFASGPADELLVVSMVWGFGMVGYGPWRTYRMLAHKDSGTRLEAIARAARDSGGSGFLALWSRATALPLLKTAMGTKFLYFAAFRDGRTSPLILDDNVPSVT
jgi:hypothetical protein